MVILVLMIDTAILGNIMKLPFMECIASCLRQPMIGFAKCGKILKLPNRRSNYIPIITNVGYWSSWDGFCHIWQTPDVARIGLNSSPICAMIGYFLDLPKVAKLG